jgi:type VI secretion system protein ImpN
VSAAVVEAYAAMRGALDALPPADRRIVREALRDALDRDGPDLRDAADLVAGTFRVEAEIHRGAAFRVLALRHRDLGTLHALKTIRPERASDPTLRAMLRREAAHHLRLHHPAVLPARALLRLSCGAPALLLDLVAGPSLAERLERGPPLSSSEWLDAARRILAALAAVHAEGLLHLDLSPSNVLLPGGDPGRALLADFGLSLPAGADGLSRSDCLAEAGTPGFAAPEADDLRRFLDARADLYGLGRTLLAALPDGTGGALRRFALGLAAPDAAARPDVLSAAAELARLARGEAFRRGRLPRLRHSRNINASHSRRINDPAASWPAADGREATSHYKSRL